MSRFSWATVALALAVATGAWLAGRLLDAGPAATLAAVCAVFLTVGATGGSLRADLRLLIVVGPVFVVAMTLPRLLTPVSTVGALASLSALVLVAGLLAGRGPRWATVGKGLALTALMSYGLPLGQSVTAGQLLAGALASLTAVVVLRLALGAGDPSGPVRAKVAAVLLTPQPDVAGALVAWLQDRPTAWLGESLVAAGVYRTIRTASQPDDERRALLETRAREVASLLRAREPGAAAAVPDQVGMTARDPAMAALDRAADAARTRGEAVVSLPPHARRRLIVAVWGAPFSWRSVHLRHAVRTSVAVLTAAIVAVTLIPPGTSLVSTLLMATYGVLQSSWAGTLRRAWQRVVGVAVGAATSVAALWMLPSEALVPLGLAALVVGIGTVAGNPPVSYAAFVVVTLGVNVGVRESDPGATLGGYLAWVGVALLIGVLFGFAAVPGVRRPGMAERVVEARNSLAGALEHLGAAPGPRDPAADLSRMRTALVASSALSAPPPRGDRTPPPDASAVQRLVDSSSALVALAGIVAAERSPQSAAALSTAAAVIRGGLPAPPGDDAGAGLPSLLMRLANEVATRLDAVPR